MVWGFARLVQVFERQMTKIGKGYWKSHLMSVMLKVWVTKQYMFWSIRMGVE